MIAENILPPLTVNDVATRLGCNPRTVWRFEGQGKIPEARRIGRKVFWDRDEFEAWYAAAGRN
jgi:excisionase family DNA binding protein